MADRHSAWGEGTDVGLIGGTAVAGFFLVRDLLAGQPMLTPSVLGQVLLFGRAEPDLVNVDLGAALLYMVVHFAVFALIGVFLTKMVHTATHNSVVRFAFLPVFLAFEVFFYGVIVAINQRTADLLPFWWVLLANTIAAASMGYYLWRTHPAFREAIAHTPLGVAEDRE
jgi:hypothetical protein